MAKVVVIKTIPGEELICELVSDTHPLYENAVTVSRPRIFQIVGDENGKPAPSIQPWIQTDPENKSVPLFMHYIATIIDAPVAIEKAYLQTVTTILL